MMRRWLSPAATTLLQCVPTSVYIHIPFCKKRCFYCDFAVIATSGSCKTKVDDLQERYTAAIINEIKQTTKAVRRRGLVIPTLDTVYFGGGTPSLLRPHLLEQIINTLKNECGTTNNNDITNNNNDITNNNNDITNNDTEISNNNKIPNSTRCGITNTTEVTLEMDPGTFTTVDVETYRQFGITRASVGVQVLNDEMLAQCNRSHTVNDTIKAIKALNDGGLHNYSIDLMHGMPGQSTTNWMRTLETAVKTFAPAHIAMYGLTIEPHTNFKRLQQQGKLSLPIEAECTTMYADACSYLSENGYTQYENSSFATTDATRSQHNQQYWKNKPFFGFGLGATSHMFGKRFARVKAISKYMRWAEELTPTIVDADVFGNSVDNVPWRRDFLHDNIILSLRHVDGLDCVEIERMYGADVIEKLLNVSESLEKAGLVHVHRAYTHTTSHRTTTHTPTRADNGSCGEVFAGDVFDGEGQFEVDEVEKEKQQQQPYRQQQQHQQQQHHQQQHQQQQYQQDEMQGKKHTIANNHNHNHSRNHDGIKVKSNRVVAVSLTTPTGFLLENHVISKLIEAIDD